MFIRFTLPQLFRLRGRSRKANTQPTPSDAVQASTSSGARDLPPNAFPDSDDPFASDFILIHPSPELRVESSLTRQSSSSTAEIQIPIIVIEDDATAFELVPTFVTPDEKEIAEKPRVTRSKSINFSMPLSKASSAGKTARRATMATRVTRRDTKRETMVAFKRNSRRASQIDFKRESQLEFMREPNVESKAESKRESKRTSKRVSRAPSTKKEKRQSRWEREINDPNTQEVLRVLSALP